MKIRFLTSIAGTMTFARGQVIEVPVIPRELAPFVDGVRAELVRDDEVAVEPDVYEQAIARRNKPRRRVKGRPEDGVPLLCPGGTVVCLGGGPSLTQDDAEFCRGKATVIAINDAYKVAPWADVLLAEDDKWWKWHSGVPSFTGLKYYLNADSRRWPGVQVLENTGAGGLELQPTGLRNGRNSGYGAINLAVHLGAVRVILLGYDMGPAADGRHHWFGDHPDREAPAYATFARYYPTIVEPLKRMGVTVINCSRQTALTVFPRMPLEDALLSWGGRVRPNEQSKTTRRPAVAPLSRMA